MALTDTEPKTGRRDSSEGTAPQGSQSSEREDSEADEGNGSEESQPNGSEANEAKESEKPERAKGIAGGLGIFLLLAIYFVWIGSEMGAHAISGTFEMWAIFGAISLGVLALLAGGAISRKAHGDERDQKPGQGS